MTICDEFLEFVQAVSGSPRITKEHIHKANMLAIEATFIRPDSEIVTLSEAIKIILGGATPSAKSEGWVSRD